MKKSLTNSSLGIGSENRDSNESAHEKNLENQTHEYWQDQPDIDLNDSDNESWERSSFGNSNQHKEFTDYWNNGLNFTPKSDTPFYHNITSRFMSGPYASNKALDEYLQMTREHFKNLANNFDADIANKFYTKDPSYSNLFGLDIEDITSFFKTFKNNFNLSVQFGGLRATSLQHFLVNFMMYLKLIYDSTKFSTFAVATGAFIYNTFQHDPESLAEIQEYVKDKYNIIESLYKRDYGYGDRSVKVKTQSDEEKSDDSPEYNKYHLLAKKLMSSELLLQIRDIFLTIVGMEFFSLSFAKKVTKHIGKPKRKMSQLEFMGYLISLLDYITHLSDQLATGTSIGEIILKGDEKSKFINAASILQIKLQTVMEDGGNNFTSDHRQSAFELLRESKLLINKASSLKKRHENDKDFSQSLASVMNISKQLNIRAKGMRRDPPVGIILHGKPQVGKSRIMTMIHKIFCTHKDYTYHEDLVYNRSPCSKFWTNYDSIANPIVHIPEVGSVHVNRAKVTGDDVINELLNVIDSAPYVGEMARVEDKDNCHIIPELVLIDTNNEGMNLKELVSNPAAVRRRFLYIEATVKDEYAGIGGALDVNKIPDDPKYRNDLHYFDVYVEHPVSVRDSQREYLAKGVDVFEFINVLRKYLKKHDEKQAKARLAAEEDFSAYLEKANSIDKQYMAQAGLVERIYNRIRPIEPHNDCLTQHPIPFYATTFITLITIPFFIATSYLSYCSDYIKYGRTYQISPLTEAYYQIQTCYRMVMHRYFYLEASNRIKKLNDRFTTDLCITPTRVLSLGILVFILKILYNNFVAKTVTYADKQELKQYSKIPSDDTDKFLDTMYNNSNVGFPKPAKRHETMDYDHIENKSALHSYEPVRSNKPSEIVNTITNNVRYVCMDLGEGNSVSTHALGIKGCFFIINTHSWSKQTDIIRMSSKPFSSSEKIFKKNNVWSKNLGNDITLVFLPGCKFNDITHYIVDTVHPDDMLVHFRGETYGGKFYPSSVTDESDPNFKPTCLYQYDTTTNRSGTCGLPVCGTFSGQTFLIGVHCAGSQEGKSYAAAITYNMIVNSINSCNKLVHSNSQGCIRLNEKSDIGPVHHRSPLLYENISSLEVYGRKTDHVICKSSSKLQLSPFIKHIRELTGVSPYRPDGHLKYGIPPMTTRKVNGVYRHPYNVWIDKIGKIKKTLNYDKCSKLAEEMTEYYIKKLKNVGISHLTPFTQKVAIRGDKNNFYVRSMKMSTSGGYSFDGPKSNWFDGSLQSGETVPIYDVKNQLKEIIDAYTHDLDSHCIVGAQLKDEPRSYEKNLLCKTRVFCMSQIDSLILNRMYLMPFYSLMVEHRDLFSTKVGICMQGKESSDMFYALSDFSTNIIEGDYGGFDTSMPVEIGLVANTLVYNILEHFGYTSTALKIVKGLLSDNLNPTIIVQGDIISCPGLQPSGKYATAEDNSLRGLILLAYSYCDMFNCSFSEFMDNNKIVTYGDDVLVSTKNDEFNSIAYSKYVKEVYGMDFTTASKGTHEHAFIQPRDMTFLKRSFSYNPIFKRIVARLDKDSFSKSLSFYTPSKHLSSYQTFLQIADSFLREYIFWCDTEKDFNRVRSIIVDRVDMGLPSNRVNTILPTFKDVVESIEKVDRASVEAQSEYKSNKRRRTEFFNGKNFHSKKHLLPVVADRGQNIAKKLLENFDDRVNEKVAELFSSLSQRLLQESSDSSKQRHKASRIYVPDSPYILKLPVAKKTKMNIEVDDVIPQPCINGSSEMMEVDENNDVNMEVDQSYIKTKLNSQSTMNGPSEMMEVDEQPSVAVESTNIEDSIAYTDVNKTDGSQFTDPYHNTNVTYGLNLTGTEHFLAKIDFPLVDDQIQLFPFHSIFNQPIVRASMRNHKYMSCNLKLKFNLMGDKFSSGLIGVSNHPWSNQTHQFRTGIRDNNTLNLMSQQPEFFTMDISNHTNRELIIPFILPRPFVNWNNNNILQSMSRLVIRPFTPLDVQSSCKLIITGHIEDLKVIGLTDRPLSVSSQSVVNKAIDMIPDEYGTKGPISSVATAVSGVMSNFKDSPTIGKFMNYSSHVFKSVGKVAGLFGFSVIPDIKPYESVKNFYSTNLNFLDNKASLVKLARDPKAEVSHYTMGHEQEPDPMFINTITKIPSMIDVRTLTTAQLSSDNIISVIPISPMLCSRDGDIRRDSALGHVASCFSFWRGSIYLDLHFVASEVTRGIVNVVFEPDMNTIPQTTRLGTTKITKIDLSTTRRVRVKVGFISDHIYLRVPSRGLSVDEFTTDRNGLGFTTGKVYIYAVTPIVSPVGPAPPVHLLTYVSSPDMKFFRPRLPKYRAYRNYDDINNSNTVTEVNSQSQSNGLETENRDSPDNVLELVLIEEIDHPVSDAHFSMSESIVSLRSLLQGYAKCHVSPSRAVNVEDAIFYIDIPHFSNSASSTSPNVPNISPESGLQPTQWVLPGNDPLNSTPPNVNLLDHFAFAFLGQRGGMRHKMCLTSHGPAIVKAFHPDVELNNGLHSRSSYPFRTIVEQQTLPDMPSVDMAVFHTGQAMPEVECIYQSVDMWKLTHNSFYEFLADDNEGDFNIVFRKDLRNLRFQIFKEDGDLSNVPGFQIMSSVSNDFTFLRWIAPAEYVYILPEEDDIEDL